jgi:hypothetical protein
LLVKTLTQKDNGAVVTLTLKSRLMIRLPTQAGTRFSWTPKAASSLPQLVKGYEESAAICCPPVELRPKFSFSRLEARIRSEWSLRNGIVAKSDCKWTRIDTNKNLTQSRLRPISPFSYVGQGRKGAKGRGQSESREVKGENVPLDGHVFKDVALILPALKA